MYKHTLWWQDTSSWTILTVRIWIKTFSCVWLASFHLALGHQRTASLHQHLHRIPPQVPPLRVKNNCCKIYLQSDWQWKPKWLKLTQNTLNSFRLLGEFSFIASQTSLNILVSSPLIDHIYINLLHSLSLFWTHKSNSLPQLYELFFPLLYL